MNHELLSLVQEAVGSTEGIRKPEVVEINLTPVNAQHDKND